MASSVQRSCSDAVARRASLNEWRRFTASYRLPSKSVCFPAESGEPNRGSSVSRPDSASVAFFQRFLFGWWTRSGPRVHRRPFAVCLRPFLWVQLCTLPKHPASPSLWPCLCGLFVIQSGFLCNVLKRKKLSSGDSTTKRQIFSEKEY